MTIKKMILALVVSCTCLLNNQIKGHAMQQSDLNNKVYLVTMINANAYHTSHQYVFFTTQGKATYVNVEDTDADGNPVVTNHATKEEQRAPEMIRQLLTRPRYLQKQVRPHLFTIQRHQRFRINNGQLHAQPTGTLAPGARPNEFTVNYDSQKQKYTSVHFKLAPQKYQYHWKK